MLVQFLSEYLESTEVEKGLSKNTIEAYGRDIESFIEYIENKNLDEITRNDLYSFIKYLRSKSYAPSSVTRKIASIKGWFRWLKINDKIKNDPSVALESPKIPQKLPKVMSIQEIDKIFSAKLNTTEQVNFCMVADSEFPNLQI